MLCPYCRKHIANELIMSEGARLMVNSRPDRKRIKDKHAAMRRKVRELTEELERVKAEQSPSPTRTTAIK